MRLITVYDNEVYASELELKAGWGFSCLIEGKTTVLFDTGWDGNLLLSNMEHLGIDPSTIEVVVLSHGHWDHAGGLSTLLHVSNPRVYVPSSLSKRLIGELSNLAEVHEVSAEPLSIAEGVYSTGVLGDEVKEQALVLDGGIVLTGCAHPGVEAILERAGELMPVRGLVGGLHSFSQLHVLSGMSLLSPCHCTVHKARIAELYPEQYVRNGVGRVIELP
ncbi:MBL fold metallo-hydrolase [Methermicoccus shengliensis]|uniref:MBL fold metallo-hydrolase n=1 Tax=Methermicoccus shengliensis TaxID=660064 RepID=A0A832RVF7_9EURY|nr:MBL fold metallo-hydrolase [Methermicoccus shengliensis]KUK04439.1 MAG: Metallo-beta-lactamase superfamily protein [Euryarchaeota archaeon 55_53]KUK30554.1 MAG: Metallo-beta-lactamase superfamily protein [Methanosarcinales archeaon 56_1174]MDI3488082.1 7,8-dihydropterin-6-yl-methyl-4-(beta-D-ribofuranosyl)aminobenzene 5-phosphate synthase [Methanosarcinales archaeon]MDN5295719.1 7,8-dihydropterin-6-yl-methyl-4-(beta-D-ribofuranosyl)aminobenzene 5-phosphate synthase [Methanosarcinales archaeo